MAILADRGLTGKPLQHKRHAEIFERLNNGEELSISSLANEWGVDPKTIQRDFDKLKQMYPEKLERSEDKKKYRKAINRKSQNDGDLIIEMLESMVKDIGVDFYKKAHPLLERLQRQIKSPFYTRLDVEDIGNKLDIILKIEKALEENREVVLSYTPYNEKNAKTYSNVRPLKMIVYEGYWYLLSQHDGHTKKFYIRSIHSCKSTDIFFKREAKIIDRLENALNIWFATDVEPYEVRLWVQKEIVTYFKRKPITKNQKLYMQNDGSAELILKVTNDEEIYPILKYWLPMIRVIEPVHIQEKFNETLSNYLKSEY